MKYEKSADGKVMKAYLTGDIDAINVLDIEEKLIREIDGVTELTVDMKELDYISSAGLRMLQKLKKRMKVQGKMEVINVSSDVMEILKVTGFVRILNITG